MNKYLITFSGSKSRTRIVEAPDATAACGLCIEKIETWEQISEHMFESLHYGCGLTFVKWPY